MTEEARVSQEIKNGMPPWGRKISKRITEQAQAPHEPRLKVDEADQR